MPKKEKNPQNAAARGSLGYSRWDRLPAAAEFRQTDGLRPEAFHFEARTRPVSSAAQDPTVEAFAAVEEELLRREQAFQRRRALLTTDKQSAVRTFGKFADVVILLCIVTCFLIFSVLAVTSNPRWYLVLGFGVSAAILKYVWKVWRGDDVNGHVSRVPVLELYFKRACPDCEHDLSAMPDAIAAVSIGDFHVGPKQCPECGSKWPLVPCAASNMRDHYAASMDVLPASLRDRSAS